MEYFIQITFVLLILSMITEKTADFVKLRFPENRLKRLLVKSEISFRMLGGKLEDKKDKRIREMQTLTFVIAMVLAYSCRANLFRIYDAEYSMGWIDVVWSDWLWSKEMALDLFGCFLTGVFLSLGSKFFHDLLGLLLDTRNLKRKLTNRESIENLHTIEEFDTYIAEVEPLVIEKEVETYLSSLEGVQHWEYSAMDETVDVFISDEASEERKSKISVRLANKTSKTIDINYLPF